MTAKSVSVSAIPDTSNVVRDTRPFVVEHDPHHPIIRVTVSGHWSEADLENYVHTIEPALRDQRRQNGIARLLVDRRLAPVQSQSIHDRLRLAASSYLLSGDALALLVDSALVRHQVKRGLGISRGEIFIEEAAAIAWLLDPALGSITMA